jgi:hypothetical protein
MKKNLLKIFVLLLIGISLPIKAARQVEIGGKVLSANTHVIAFPDQPTATELNAAMELAKYLEKITGEKIPLVGESQIGKALPLLVGHCTKALKANNIAVNFKALGMEGIHIESVGPVLALAGNQRGVLYAVYTFLEDSLGCRWFAEDCEVVPNSGKFKLSELKKIYVPKLEYRDIDYPESRDRRFAVRNKINGIYLYDVDAEWGSHTKYAGGFVHTFNRLLPPEVYGAKHPEYYSEINGKRVVSRSSQLCLTNPEVLRLVIKKVRKWLRENPDASIVSVSQNDCHFHCVCSKCAKLVAKEGSQSGPMLYFVNAVAEAIHDEFPNVVVDTLAYHETRKPPLHVKPHPNVAIRLCSIECCFLHTLDDPSCERNRKFVRDIKNWSKICNRLYIWNYVINYAHSVMPFPNWKVIGRNIQFFVNHGAAGVYEEGNYYSRGGELAPLRSYLMAKCLWDPNFDYERGLVEFTDAYYGPAAPMIREYLELIHSSVIAQPNVHMRIYNGPDKYLALPKMRRAADAIFDRAEAAVAGRKFKKERLRVETARMPLIYLKSQFKEHTSEEMKRFSDWSRRVGLTHMREGGKARSSVDAYLQRTR